MQDYLAQRIQKKDIGQVSSLLEINYIIKGPYNRDVVYVKNKTRKRKSAF
jgi:hypothetical protein